MSRGLGDVYKRQVLSPLPLSSPGSVGELPPLEHAKIIITSKYLFNDLIIDVI